MPPITHGSTLALSLDVPTHRAAAGGDANAQSEVLGLFDECRDAAYRYALSFGLDFCDAEDVVQEVFLALYRHLTCGGGRSNLRGWIFRVTRNLALKRRAGRSRFARLFVIPGAACEKPDPSSNPEQRMLSTQRYARLQAIVRALPQRDRQCLQLRAEGLRYRDIAEALGVSLGSVANALARALARLHRADDGEP